MSARECSCCPNLNDPNSEQADNKLLVVLPIRLKSVLQHVKTLHPLQGGCPADNRPFDQSFKHPAHRYQIPVLREHVLRALENNLGNNYFLQTPELGNNPPFFATRIRK
jgi:hypothetical protein